MWIFLNNAALSIVADRSNPANLLVRARLGGDIERVFHDAVVQHTPTANYAYRASIPRKQVGAVMAAKLVGIEYDNFKGSIAHQVRHEIYLAVWDLFRLWCDTIASGKSAPDPAALRLPTPLPTSTKARSKKISRNRTLNT